MCSVKVFSPFNRKNSADCINFQTRPPSSIKILLKRSKTRGKKGLRKIVLKEPSTFFFSPCSSLLRKIHLITNFPLFIMPVRRDFSKRLNFFWTQREKKVQFKGHLPQGLQGGVAFLWLCFVENSFRL